MKKTLFLILSSTALMAAADPSMSQAPSQIDFQTPANFSLQSMNPVKTGFFYVRFASAEGDLANVRPLHPGLGVGYRRLTGEGAFDISISGIGRSQRSGREFLWAAPKATYIHYLQPNNEKSLYLGGGLIWGGVRREEKRIVKHPHIVDEASDFYYEYSRTEKVQKFTGIIPTFSAGYEFFRKTAVLGFIELNLSQPAVAVTQEGVFPGPIAELSLGAGF